MPLDCMHPTSVRRSGRRAAVREVERVLINRISSSMGGIWNPAQDVRIPIISVACWAAVGAKSWVDSLRMLRLLLPSSSQV